MVRSEHSSPTEPGATDSTVADGATLPAGSSGEPGTTARAGAALDPVDADRYTSRHELTRGGMGRIVTAYDRRLRRTVALKELRADRPDLRARFEREALLTARLEHPSIVNIHDAGRWPSGEPFYAMKLVSGRSLDVVIAEARTLAERLALLPHVIAVADALGYAHSRRVIHRDLKPQNVLVGEFGETVVIDWGLAKDLDDTSESRPGAAPVASHAEAETIAGDVLGTPAYMPPQQAEGAPVDERADVYALGALLYHVLSGAAPYDGRTSAEVVLAVRHGPPPPLVERQPEVPADLLAVVERAMARDPAARYPTGREVGDDLRRFQAGQLVGAHRYSIRQLLGRWIRRHRAAVAVASAALAVLLVVGGVGLRRIVQEQERAERARRQAEANRADAEDLLGFMLFDLRDKLKPLGRLDLLAAPAQKARAYYERVDDDRPRSIRRRATAMASVAGVLRAQGETAEALATHRQVLALREKLAVRQPGDVGLQREISLAHNSIGDILVDQGDAPGALASYRAAMAIRERALAQAPDDAGRLRDVSFDQQRIGTVLLIQGDTAAALVALRAALALDERLAARAPEDVRAQEDLAVSHDAIGRVLLAQGDAVAALEAHRAALAVRERLVARHPDDPDRLQRLAFSHDKIGEALSDRGDHPGALASFRAALAIVTRLSALDPSNSNWRRDLAICQHKVGRTLLAGQDLDGALDVFRAAEEATRGLAAQDASNAARQRDHSISLDYLGDVYLAQGDPAAALASYRRSLAIAAQLVAKDDSNAMWKHDLVQSHENVGHALRAAGDGPAALASYQAALAIADSLVAMDPDNAEWIRETATIRAAIAACCGP